MNEFKDRTIYIVGPRRVQNEAIAFFLSKETGADCRVLPSRVDLPPVEEHEAAPLVLVDCPNGEIDNFFSTSASNGNTVSAGYCLTLFNVRSDKGVEKTAVQFGIRGFFYEQDSPERFIKGISALMKGEMWLSRELMAKVIAETRTHNHDANKKDVVVLTQREIEILTMVVEGFTNEEIARKLHISAHTVKTHIYNIFKKIDVPNRLQAALWAAKNL